MSRQTFASFTLALTAMGAATLSFGAGSTGVQATVETPSTPAQPPVEESPRGPIAARVNGVPIYKIDFDSAVQNFIKSQNIGGSLTDEQTQQLHQIVLDGLIGSELLYQKAQSIPIEVSSTEVEQTVAQARASMGDEAFESELNRRLMSEKDLQRLIKQNLTVQRMIQDVIVSRVDVSEQEIEQFYNQHQSDMKKPERVEASHILVKSSASDSDAQKAEARRKIQEAEKRVQSGEDFASLARQFSDDGTASNGGRLGEIQRGQTVPTFEEAAFKLHEGEVSGVVESPYGFHIIKVTKRENGASASLNEAHDTIAQFLKQKKAQDAIEDMVQSLRAEAKVEVL